MFEKQMIKRMKALEPVARAAAEEARRNGAMAVCVVVSPFGKVVAVEEIEDPGFPDQA